MGGRQRDRLPGRPDEVSTTYARIVNRRPATTAPPVTVRPGSPGARRPGPGGSAGSPPVRPRAAGARPGPVKGPAGPPAPAAAGRAAPGPARSADAGPAAPRET